MINGHQQDRMQILQGRLENMRSSKARYDALRIQTREAKVVYEKAVNSFKNYKDDLVGDIFNGCFGQEWLLHVED